MSIARTAARREEETGLKLTYAVGRFHRVLRAELTRRLKAHDLTIPEFTALSVLSRRGGLSNAQLARRSFVTPQAMNQVLATLEAKGLVSRPAPGDPQAHHRARGTKLTARGRALVRRTDVLVDELEERAFAAIAPADRLTLAAQLLDAGARLRADDAGSPDGPSMSGGLT